MNAERHSTTAGDREQHFALVWIALRSLLAFEAGGTPGGRAVLASYLRVLDALANRAHEVGAGDDPGQLAFLRDRHPRLAGFDSTD